MLINAGLPFTLLSLCEMVMVNMTNPGLESWFWDSRIISWFSNWKGLKLHLKHLTSNISDPFRTRWSWHSFSQRFSGTLGLWMLRWHQDSCQWISVSWLDRGSAGTAIVYELQDSRLQFFLVLNESPLKSLEEVWVRCGYLRNQWWSHLSRYSAPTWFCLHAGNCLSADSKSILAHIPRHTDLYTTMWICFYVKILHVDL